MAKAALKLAPRRDDLPIIHIEPNEIERVVDQAEAALMASERGLYQRDGRIVGASDVTIIASKGRAVIGQRIVEIEDYALAEHLACAAVFMKFDRREKTWIATHPPLWVTKTLRERKGKLRFKILTAIVNAPTLRSDGSLVDKPGYDEQTGLLFDPLGVQFPAIPARPSRRDAEAALVELRALIESFPFVSEVDLSVALSGLISAPARRSVPTCPLHGFSATAAGTGKSMLVDLASILATGHEAPVIGQGSTDEELEKRLGATLLAGDSVIAVDNCERPIGGDTLCSMLTQLRVKPRVLGKSSVPETTSAAFIAATGNNLTVLGDLTRRALICRLDARCERPETRVFRFNPIERAKANRASLIVAALTILRAYVAAGRPGPASALGSFTEWSGLVRDALIWLGCADPCESMDSLRKEDPKRVELSTIMAHWGDAFGAALVTTADVIRAADERIEENGPATGLRRPEFRDALLQATGERSTLNALSFAKWLSRRGGQVIDGQRFERGGTKKNVTLWVLARIPSA